MKYREQKTLLEEAGFQVKRRGKKHELWTNGDVTIPVNPGVSIKSYHTRRAFLVEIKRAKEKQMVSWREAEEQKRKEREEKMKSTLTTKMGDIHMAPRPLPIAPQPAAKERIGVNSIRSKAKELMKGGKTAEEAITILLTAFDAVTPFGATLRRERLIELAEAPWERGNRPKEYKKRSEPVLAKADSVKVTASEIDEKMKHIRAVIDMPFDKEKKIEIIIDLLDKII